MLSDRSQKDRIQVPSNLFENIRKKRTTIKEKNINGEFHQESKELKKKRVKKSPTIAIKMKKKRILERMETEDKPRSLPHNKKIQNLIGKRGGNEISLILDSQKMQIPMTPRKGLSYPKTLIDLLAKFLFFVKELEDLMRKEQDYEEKKDIKSVTFTNSCVLDDFIMSFDIEESKKIKCFNKLRQHEFDFVDSALETLDRVFSILSTQNLKGIYFSSKEIRNVVKKKAIAFQKKKKKVNFFPKISNFSLSPSKYNDTGFSTFNSERNGEDYRFDIANHKNEVINLGFNCLKTINKATNIKRLIPRVYEISRIVKKHNSKLKRLIDDYVDPEAQKSFKKNFLFIYFG